MSHEIRDRLYPFKGNECGCPTCYRIFTGEKAFDRHRKEGQCVDPASMSLTLDWKGRWTTGLGTKREFK